MASLLMMALEAEFAQPINAAVGDASGGTPEASEGNKEEDMLTLKGPLAMQFSAALSEIFNKHKTQREQDAEEKATDAVATEAVATESQANDALMAQDLEEDRAMMSQAEAPDESTTIYGVSGADVTPEDVVEISQDLLDYDPEKEDYAVVMTSDVPSVNGQGGGENAYAAVLESMCERKGVKVYPSLEAYFDDVLPKP